MSILPFIAVGVLGGLVRSLYGLFKAVARGERINKLYFLATLVVSGLIGGLIASVFSIDIKIAALAGYAGTDLLEAIFKAALPASIVLKKS